MPDDVPGPARRMAEHLGSIVRAATAVESGTPWVSAVPCRRRPNRRQCPGTMAVFRTDLPRTIEWRCMSCADEGVISGWERSPFDLRPSRPQVPATVPMHAVIVTEEVVSTLRALEVVDLECERVIFGASADDAGIWLTITEEDLEELMGTVAAEANHEPDRRRQRRLDTAFSAIKKRPRGPPFRRGETREWRGCQRRSAWKKPSKWRTPREVAHHRVGPVGSGRPGPGWTCIHRVPAGPHRLISVHRRGGMARLSRNDHRRAHVRGIHMGRYGRLRPCLWASGSPFCTRTGRRRCTSTFTWETTRVFERCRSTPEILRQAPAGIKLRRSLLLTFSARKTGSVGLARATACNSLIRTDFVQQATSKRMEQGVTSFN
jgi:hypothetical protein